VAVTERYVDPAGGNDYIGATFTDGVYTDSSKNLLKTNAFTASKVGHYLYLTGTGITSGYYKIATRTDASNVVLATDAGADATDVVCTQATGTSSLPFHTVQGALDLTTRNATDGDRINVKAGSTLTLDAALDYTTYGTPTAAAQLIIQGYTSAADDGGIGVIDGAATYSICASWTYSSFIGMKLGNTGTADVLDFGINSNAVNCEIHTSSGFGVDTNNSCLVVGCWLHDLTGAQAIDNSGYVKILYNFIDCAVTTSVIDGGSESVVIGNIIDLSGADTSVIGISAASASMTILQNTIYCSSANTGQGIYMQGASGCVLNNVIEGWSGAGGDGIETTVYSFIGANAVYNCTNAYTFTAAKLNYAIAPNDTIATSSPFTDAANNDFSIVSSKAGVTEDAYPSSFRGL
jgi:hypothetical protein